MRGFLISCVSITVAVVFAVLNVIAAARQAGRQILPHATKTYLLVFRLNRVSKITSPFNKGGLNRPVTA